MDVVNASDECFQLALVDGGHSKLDAAWLKENLRAQTNLSPELAGVGQDTARTCQKAFRLQNSDLMAANREKYGRLSYVDCGEHVSQLLANPA